MNENYNLFEELIKGIKDAEIKNMFGKPCGKLKKKAFASFFENEMVFRIGRANIDELTSKYIGAKTWDPSGKNRAMKDWLQVPGEHKADWKKLLNEAIKFTNSI